MKTQIQNFPMNSKDKLESPLILEKCRHPFHEAFVKRIQTPFGIPFWPKILIKIDVLEVIQIAYHHFIK